MKERSKNFRGNDAMFATVDKNLDHALRWFAGNYDSKRPDEPDEFSNWANEPATKGDLLKIANGLSFLVRAIELWRIERLKKYS